MGKTLASAEIIQILERVKDECGSEIDDTAGTGDTTKVWSADKSATELQTLKSAINVLEDEIDAVHEIPSGGTSGQILTKTSGSDYDVQWSSVGTPTDAQVADAVSDWLDEHPEATTTVDFSIATKVFPNVSDMASDLTLKNGDNVATRGYYASGDNGGANYVVSSTHTGVFYIELENGLYANRLDESGLIKAESIGIKAYSAETANPDSDDMSNNVLLFNKAVYNGVSLFFGEGYYYFNAPVQLARKNTYTIQGLTRQATHLIFPESDGFLFADPIYYNYYVIMRMHIHAYGHTIRCAEHCLTVLDSHFEWLQLESETGDCFHAPDYNVAKYTSQSGVTVYDTCVQNCVFDFVNASAPQGAAFCNIMGMYTYYMHMNFVSCKYAFRNCDGIVQQANTLGSQEDYYIYYDKTNSHGLKWLFINTNAEGISKAFIYTEPRVEPAPGEDPKKPETANICSISSLVAIDSSWSLRGVESGHDVYPITVQNLQGVNLINSDRIVKPSQYPEKYDTSVVKGEIHVLTNSFIKRYYGGPTIKEWYTSYGYNIYGDVDRSVLLRIDEQEADNTDVPLKYDTLSANRLYGGRCHQTFSIESSSDTIVTNSNTIPYSSAYADLIVFKSTNSGSGEDVSLVNMYMRYAKLGTIITLQCSDQSTKKIKLLNKYTLSHFAFYYGDSPSEQIIIEIGACVHLILTSVITNGNVYKMWRPLMFKDL